MIYYQAIFNLSEESSAINFDCSVNISSFELKKINYEEQSSIIHTPIIFKTDTKDGTKELDVNLSNHGSIIVSEKFKKIFQNEPLDFFPIELENYSACSNYYIIKILFFLDCINETKTKITYWTEENASFNKKLIGNYKTISNITVNEEKINGINIFRLKKFTPIILVSQKFVDTFVSNQCNGLKFIPISSHK